MLLDPNIPRCQWKIGHTIEFYPGSDGLVRVVKVQTEDAALTRAIHRLCRLEQTTISPAPALQGTIFFAQTTSIQAR